MEHELITPGTCQCDKRSEYPCPVCDGGLGICKACGAAEIELEDFGRECQGSRQARIEKQEAMTGQLWCVIFETDSKMYHPVSYGKKHGPVLTRRNVQEAAENYLRENKPWLVRIDDIYIEND